MGRPGPKSPPTGGAPKLDPRQILEEMYEMAALAQGFDVRECRAWLATLGDSPLRAQVLDRLAKARDGFFSDGPFELREAKMLRHLEWLHLRRQVYDHDGYVLPLASLGERVKMGGKKGAARNTNSKRAKILDCAAAYSAINPDSIRTIARRTSATSRTVRDTLREAGLYKPRGK